MPTATGTRRKRPPRWFLFLAGGIALIAIATAIIGMRISPIVRQKAIAILQERYQSKVELKEVTVSLFPRVSVSGKGLVFYHRGRTDLPPMIKIESFLAHARLKDLLNRPIHIREINLRGMELHLPPKRSNPDKDQGSEQKPSTVPASAAPGSALLVIDEIHADGTALRILPKDPGKEPLEFDISKLRLHSVGNDRPMEFEAVLTNPKPPGLIRSNGHFGPWQSGEPGSSDVDGHYTFTNADLGVFSGIAGTLSSEGDYKGQLNNIDVTGTTDTPNFVVKTGDHPVDLKTKFHAVVDGTNGNTYLQPVEASFLQSTLVCSGSVEGHPGTKGKFITLDIVMDRGRIEDLLRLAVKGKEPVMRGASILKTKFLLSPGDADVMERLQLDGTFEVKSGRFTGEGIQGKIAELSARGRGKPKEAQELAESGGVASDLRARFTYNSTHARFASLSFAVPGSQVRLSGQYGMKSEKVDFTGTLRMQAKVSQTMTGWKSWVLKPADPFFAKHGAGSEIPISIGGTREKPEFGLALFGKKK